MKIIGTVVDKQGLFGANVFVSDKNGKLLSPPNGKATDPDGKYELNNINEGDYITASSIGYATKTHQVQDVGGVVNFVLKPTTTQLEEFTVIEEIDKPNLMARKDKRNYTPYIIGGISLLVLIGGYFTYKKFKG